jgi:hypothetical protein
MDTIKEETYVFWRGCARDFQDCKDTLALLGEATNESMRLALIKYATIAYARPFSSNNAEYKKQAWKLDIEKVPEEYMSTHFKALYYRDKVIAHSDIRDTNPVLLKSDKHHGIGRNGPDYDEYFVFSEKLSVMSLSLFDILCADIKKYEVKHQL